MKNKTELAEEWYNKNKYLSDFPKDRQSFIAGYSLAIEKIKEYLFNTEEHQNKYDKFYISEEYLKQTIIFLNDES